MDLAEFMQDSLALRLVHSFNINPFDGFVAAISEVVIPLTVPRAYVAAMDILRSPSRAKFAQATHSHA